MPARTSRFGRSERETSFEQTPEYIAFIDKLHEYHARRGTPFEPEPKVGSRHLDLLRLYDRVIGEGGYDMVSNTREKPLMWRKIAEEFIGTGQYIGAQAFQVKSVYYKFLAAYEITEYWHEVPPPKEILESLTARGGGIRGRTVESFDHPALRESMAGGSGNGSESEGEDGGSAIARTSRGLRQAPPQRVLFQPEPVPARASRSVSVVQQPQFPEQSLHDRHRPSPSPGPPGLNYLAYPPNATNGAITTLASYEPSQQYPLSMKPVSTPANNPEAFRLRKRQLEEAAAPAHVKRLKGIMLPGTGFIGPNIYVRAQLALQSGLADEQRYALHHLVKISHERGDKYRFDQFPGLAEALIQKMLHIGELFYNLKVNVSYRDVNDHKSSVTLDGINPTSHVLEKLQVGHFKFNPTWVQEESFSEELNRIIEAGLILRNMVMLSENAAYVSKIPLVRDFIIMVLNIDHDSVVELQLYALEIMEQLCVYLRIDSTDDLYQSLQRHLDSSDRGKIVVVLKTIARLGMNFKENKRLENVPRSIVRNVCAWLLLDDEELRSACLDFLYQYTSTSQNVEMLIQILDCRSLASQITSLLLYDAKQILHKSRMQHQQDLRQQSPAVNLPNGSTTVIPEKVPRLAVGLVEQLLGYEEPERSTHWLNMCFQDDPNAEMTQIDLWKSYQGTFLPYSATHPHLIAGDFIKNVSNTFKGASAQVTAQQKFVIRGIKPRLVPVDYRKRELHRCQWRGDPKDKSDQIPAVFAYVDSDECGQFFPNGSTLLDHILLRHLEIPRKKTDAEVSTPSGQSGNILLDLSAMSDVIPKCTWSTCPCPLPSSDSSDVDPKVSWAILIRHIKTHMPLRDSTTSSSLTNEKEKLKSTEGNHYWLNTAVDETLKDACGIPLGAALCLRNIVRGLTHSSPASESNHDDDEHEKDIDEDGDDSGDENFSIKTTEVDDSGDKKTKGRGKINDRRVQGLVRDIFAPLKERLFFAMGHNYVLKDYVLEIVRYLVDWDVI